MTPPASSPSKIRWGQILVWSGLVALLALVGVGLLRTQQGQVGVGQPAPDFTLTGLPDTPYAGQTFKLSDARGQVVVINFWASWCIPCRDEARMLEEAWQMYQDQGVLFVGLAWSDTESKSILFVKEFEQTYFNGTDLGTRAGQAYRITGVPETYIVDKNGVLAWVKLFPISSVAELQGVIEPLLK
jgi:cytochrome c biogenesis protein CcmG/thiol:disulfide interchange protein DsbE